MSLDEGRGFFLLLLWCLHVLTLPRWVRAQCALGCSTEVQGDFAFDFNDIMKWVAVLCVCAHQRDEQANLFSFVQVKVHNRDSSQLTAYMLLGFSGSTLQS